MKGIFLVVGSILTIIGLIWGAVTQIEWIIYTGIPLIFLFGSAGLTFVTKRIEAVIVGMVLAALWPELLQLLQTAISTLPK
ncbi:MAG: hypothetical protein ABR954_00985 [Dehalococcoidales bacterium]